LPPKVLLLQECHELKHCNLSPVSSSHCQFMRLAYTFSLGTPRYLAMGSVSSLRHVNNQYATSTPHSTCVHRSAITPGAN
jgi:hypothetical protein